MAERARRARVKTGEQRGARRRAQRVGAECIAEHHAFAADAVVVGSLQDGISGNRESVVALPFAQKEHDIRLLWSTLR